MEENENQTDCRHEWGKAGPAIALYSRALRPRFRAARVLLICFLFISSAGLRGQAVPDPELRRDLVARRARFMEQMHHPGMLLLWGGEAKRRNGDVNYEFRQESNIYYLTGINEEGIALVLFPESAKCREILFLPRRNPSAEIWIGPSLSADEARETSGIPNVWDTEELEPFLEGLLFDSKSEIPQNADAQELAAFRMARKEGRAAVHLLLGNRSGTSGQPSREQQLAARLKEVNPGWEAVDVAPIFSRMREVKSSYEIAQLRRAIDITAEAQIEAMRNVRPGKWEYEVEALLEWVFKRDGSSGWAFPSIVGSGPNATTLHYDRNRRRMLDGELLLIDAGAEFNCYAADITRTVPVNGRFSKEQREIYELVLAMNKAAIRAIRPGATLADVSLDALRILREGLYDLGLITDRNNQQQGIYLMHGISHPIGLDVHDVGNRGPLEPGMVLTVEPGIYVRADALERLEKTAGNEKLIKAIRGKVERYRNIGVRIEDDVLVTKDGCEVLSSKAPKEIKDIERHE